MISAPENFTAAVMDKIEAVPARNAYKPLIGRGGRIAIVLFIIAIVVISVFYTDSGSTLLGAANSLPRVEWQLPQFHLKLDFLKQINISTGVVSGLVAMFVLVLSDAGLSRRRLIQ